ncbi:MAG: hypothetical protein E7256_17140 [Lachnospiraceae bacterium]|nr:hypothetical protein [Lachnospiraceae bacterium]
MEPEEELVEELDESLKQQIGEMDLSEAADRGSGLPEDADDNTEENQDNGNGERIEANINSEDGQDAPNTGNTGGKKKKCIKIALIVLGVVVVLLGGLIGTKTGRGMVYSMIGTYIKGKTKEPEPAVGLSDHESEEQPQITPILLAEEGEEENVKNYLLFGIEEIGGGGRTDVMMIASINKRDKTIRLTSFLRDLYVEIPGYSEDRLNAAYGYGGADTLVNAIQQNFNIPIEGYVHVNFSAFEQVVDLLGGIDIELGKSEASYLNRTNYISNVEERNVTAGLNHLTGNQALGYCRIRKVVTLGGANNDFGRTLRHRRVITAIFEKYKEKNPIELFNIMNECLGYVTTNLSADQITEIMEDVMENQIFTIENDHIPQDNMYSDYYTPRGEAVLVPDLEANNEFLYDFIYNDPEETLTTENTDAKSILNPTDQQ